MASILEALLIGAFVGIASAVYWYSRFRASRRKLYEMAEKLPGPSQLPMIGHLHRFLGDTEDIMTTLKEISYLSNHEGGVSKFWIGHMLFCMPTEPADVEHILKVCLEKAEVTHFFRKIIGNGIVFAPASIWRRRRRVISPAFSLKSLGMIVELFAEKSNVLASQLENKVGVGQFDLWPFYSSYTLDSIFETVLGYNTKARTSDYLQVLSSMEQLLRLVSERLFHLWIQPDWLFRFTPSFRIFDKSKKFALSFTDEVIRKTKIEMQEEERKKPEVDLYSDDEPLKRKSFLSYLITQSKKGEAYTDVELREEVLSLGVAGTDTSATGSCFTLLLLARHQHVQEKLYQELLEVFGKSDRSLEKEDLPRLCYLEQVIKESMRLFPPIPMISRQAEKDITLPSGIVIPGGCDIPISIWGLHHNAAYWGADVELFRPERFDPENLKLSHPCVYMPFSVGSRNCVGYQYAMMSMKTSLSTLLRRYRVCAPAGTTAHIRVKFEITMKAVGGYNIILESRE